MGPYRPLDFRPYPSSPGLGHYSLAQRFEHYLGFTPAFGDGLRLIGHAAGTWLGIRVGMKEKGFVSAVGWIIGIGMAITGATDIISLIERASGTHPTETP